MASGWQVMLSLTCFLRLVAGQAAPTWCRLTREGSHPETSRNNICRNPERVCFPVHRLHQMSDASARSGSFVVPGAAADVGTTEGEGAAADAGADTRRPTLAPTVWSYPGNGGFKLRGRGYLRDRKKVCVS